MKKEDFKKYNTKKRREIVFEALKRKKSPSEIHKLGASWTLIYKIKKEFENLKEKELKEQAEFLTISSVSGKKKEITNALKRIEKKEEDLDKKFETVLSLGLEAKEELLKEILKKVKENGLGAMEYQALLREVMKIGN